MSTYDRYSFVHKDLGVIVGIQRDNIVQFRGIPFATIPARFRQSVLLEALPHSPYNATNPGVICPQIGIFPPPFWTEDESQGCLHFELPGEDELSCLNLTISMPLKVTKNTPVLVFIHGGALMLGSNSVQIGGVELFDGYDLVHKSLMNHSDILVVCLNYRVGTLGFLASEELFDHNRSHHEPQGNYGLHDQRRGIEWVRRYIEGFGGDPKNITVHGTSAGAASTHLQTMFPNPQFRRAILSSGNFYTLPPWTLTRHQLLFHKLCRAIPPALGLTNLENLLQAPARTVVDALIFASINPVIDEDFVRGPRLEDNDMTQGVDEIMIGCTAHEHDVVYNIMKDFSEPPYAQLQGSRLLERIRELLDPQTISASRRFPFDAPALLQKYGIRADHHPEKYFDAWVLLVSDFMFRASAFISADKCLQDVYAYNIVATNPYPSNKSTFSKAHHGINDLFLFNPAPEIVPKEFATDFLRTVDQFQKVVVEFCHGKQPWPKFSRRKGIAGPVYVFNEEGESCSLDHAKLACGTEEWSKWQHFLQVASGVEE